MGSQTAHLVDNKTQTHNKYDIPASESHDAHWKLMNFKMEAAESINCVIPVMK